MARLPQQHQEHPVKRRLKQIPLAQPDDAPAQIEEPTLFAQVSATIRNLVEKIRKGQAGWGASLLLHAALLLCLYGIIIGIKDRPDSMSIDSVMSEQTGDQPFDSLLDEAALNPDQLEMPDQSLMAIDQEFLVQESNNLIAASKENSKAGNLLGGEQAGGKVGFFGSSATGNSFVFIVDSSGSMTGQRFERAKLELRRSLERLKARQKFHVVFFNGDTYPMYTPREEVGLVAATSSNKKLARRWIRSQQPGSTTNPEAAIRLALQLKPDVIFLLSDGEFDEPELSREAARAENSGTVIHTIALISRDGEETLKAIANDNSGTYRFVK